MYSEETWSELREFDSWERLIKEFPKAKKIAIQNNFVAKHTLALGHTLIGDVEVEIMDLDFVNIEGRFVGGYKARREEVNIYQVAQGFVVHRIKVVIHE